MQRAIRGEGSGCPSLDGDSLQFQDDPRRRLPFQERAVRDAWPQGRRPPADARLFDSLPELCRGARVFLNQGPERPAHFAPAASRGRRQHPRRPQTDWHARARQPARWTQPVPSGDRNRACAVPRHDPRSGNLRALLDRRPRAWRAHQSRARLSRPDRVRTPEGRISRRAHRIFIALLSDSHARAVPQSGPHPRPHRVRENCSRIWGCRCSTPNGTA